MLLSAHTASFLGYNDYKKAIKCIKDAGFDAYDFSFIYAADPSRDIVVNHDDYLARIKEIREYADKLGIVCNQAHAPFPSVVIDDERANEKRLEEIKRSIKAASILGAKIIVVHPWNNYNAKQNAEFYLQLVDVARENHIKIALENMWNWEKGKTRASFAACATPDDFLKTISPLPKDVFTCCLDIGHAEMMEDTSAVEMIYALKDYLGALHIHDNDKIHDNHALPYTRNIDFDKIIKALKDVHYSGDVTLEVEEFMRLDTSLFPSYAKRMYEVANKIRNELLR